MKNAGPDSISRGRDLDVRHAVRSVRDGHYGAGELEVEQLIEDCLCPHCESSVSGSHEVAEGSAMGSSSRDLACVDGPKNHHPEVADLLPGSRPLLD